MYSSIFFYNFHLKKRNTIVVCISNIDFTLFFLIIYFDNQIINNDVINGVYIIEKMHVSRVA